MTQWRKVFVTKNGDLGSVPGTPLIKEQNPLQQVVLRQALVLNGT